MVENVLGHGDTALFLLMKLVKTMKVHVGDDTRQGCSKNQA